MRPTLEQIAQRAGVASSTVSVTLRDHPRAKKFSAATRERILAVAKELNYRPNFFAAQLRREHCQVLALHLAHLNDAYCNQIAAEFARQAKSKGYESILSPYDREASPADSMPAVLAPHGIKAIAVVGSNSSTLTDDELHSLVDHGHHVVLVGRRLNHPKVSEVCSDDAAGGRAVARLILRKGHRKVWVLTVCNTRGAMLGEDRVRAFREELAQAGHRPPRILVTRGDAGDQTNRMIDQAIAQDGLPDAIFSTTDQFAYRVIQTLHARNIRAGVDVDVVGYDDVWPSALFAPSLTTVRQPMGEMGACAADLLIEMLSEPASAARKVTLAPTLIARASCADPDTDAPTGAG